MTSSNPLGTIRHLYQKGVVLIKKFRSGFDYHSEPGVTPSQPSTNFCGCILHDMKSIGDWLFYTLLTFGSYYTNLFKIISVTIDYTLLTVGSYYINSFKIISATIDVW